jgi:hypothetical protein
MVGMQHHCCTARGAILQSRSPLTITSLTGSRAADSDENET